MTRDLNCTEFQATIGLSVYPLGFGVVPMVTSAFSEEFGRQPLYLSTSVGFTLMFPMIALCVLPYSCSGYLVITHLC
jgi:MFS family permease